MRGPLRAVGAMMVMDSIDDRFPSDHYFVMSDFDLIPSAASTGQPEEEERLEREAAVV